MTIAQQLEATSFPFKLYNEKGKKIYSEDSKGYWEKYQHNEQGNQTYYENSTGYWKKRQYDERGNKTYYEDSTGFWEKYQYDERGNQTYYEDSYGNIRDNRPKEKVVLTMDDIAKKFNITTEQLQIKK
jgi:hypothetical protein